MTLVRAILALIILSVTAFSQKSPSQYLVINHVTVIDMTGVPPRKDMTVVIENDRIKSIGPTSQTRRQSAKPNIDGRGLFLIPGLWDMHVHFNEVARTFPMFIANGVTGVRNVGGDLDQLLKWRAEVDSGKLLGPRIVTCGPIVDGPDPAAHGPTVVVANAAEARRVADDLKKRGADCIKVYDRLPREAYFGIIEEARKIGLPVVGHVPLSITSLEASEAGQISIEHLGNFFESASSVSAELLKEESPQQPVKDPSEFPRRIAARGTRMLDTYDPERAHEIFKAFVKNGTWQVPTLETKWTQTFIDDLASKPDERLKYIPASERQWWSPEKNFFARYRTPEYITYKKRLFERELGLVGDMHRAGVRFMTGTDLSNAYVFAGFSVHHEMELLVKAGLTPLEALQAGTRNPSIFLGEAKTAGTVEAGKIANLVLLEANPLDDIRNTQRINAVVLKGQYLSKQKLQSLLDQAAAAAQ
jgi:Amidohydrolase family